MRVTGQEVIAYVAEYYLLSIGDLKGSSRSRRLARPRQIACYVMRCVCPHLSFPAIGRLLGGRDHTTVLHAVSKVSDLMAVDAEIECDVADILAHFHRSTASDVYLRARIIDAERHLEALKAQAAGSPALSEVAA